MQTDIDPRNLIGRKAFDRKGTKIGTVDEVYLDDATGVPEWAAIRTGLFSRDAFVPLEPSEHGGRRAARAVRPRPDQGRARLRRGPPPLARAGTPALPPLRPRRLRAPDRTPCRRRTGDFGRTAGRTTEPTRHRLPAPQRPAPPAAPAAAARPGSGPGRRHGTCAPARARSPGVSKRTVTRPSPLPCTHPCAVLAVPHVVPGQPAPRGPPQAQARPRPARRRRSCGSRPGSAAPLLRAPGRTDPPGCSRRARLTPTPSSRTPPVVSTRLQEPRGRLPHHAGVVRGAAQRLGPGQRGEVVAAHLQDDGPARAARASRSRRTQRSASRSHLGAAPAPGRGCRRRTCPRRRPTSRRARPPRAGRRAPAPSRTATLPCALPSSRTSSSSPASAISATVVMPGPAQVVPGGGAHARQGPHRQRGRAGPARCPGSISTRPSGLACSEAIFASIFEPARPTDPVSPVTAVMSARSRSPAARADAASQAAPPASRSTNASSRLSGSTSGDSAPQQPHHLLADLPVQREARHEVRGVRREPAGLRHRHRRVHPEHAGPRTRRWRPPRAARARPPPPACPRRLGLDACSAEAKKASMSRCRMVGAVLTSPMLPYATDIRDAHA